MTTIWDPITLGGLDLPHRLAMAPMTRSRAAPNGAPTALAAEYYAQRAGLGLLIAEGTQPSEDGQGYLNTPGLHSPAQAAGWRAVADAVHARNGRIFVQVMHVGRMSHPDNTPHHRLPVAPSAIASGEQMFTPSGMQDMPTPRALSEPEVAGVIDEFRRAAALAVEAGLDGVELHGANGYLIQQFLAPSANTRTDRYGGGIENRARFAIEVARAVAAEIGPERTGIRLSPGARLGGIDEGPDGADLYRYLIPELGKLDLAYLHMMFVGEDAWLREIRALWPNALLINRPGQSPATLGADIEAGLADMAPVGRLALANPDLVERLRAGAPFNEPDPDTFYSGGADGYTDYPTLAAAAAA